MLPRQGDEMWYRACVDLVVVGHLLFIGFVVGGAFLTWRWPVIIWAHIPAVIYGALVEFAGFTCPLTLLENDLRQRAGEAGYRGGFISHYLVEVIYPSGLTHGMQIGLGLLLLVVAIIGYWGFLRRHAASAQKTSVPRGNRRFRAFRFGAGRQDLGRFSRAGRRGEQTWRVAAALLYLRACGSLLALREARQPEHGEDA